VGYESGVEVQENVVVTEGPEVFDDKTLKFEKHIY